MIAFGKDNGPGRFTWVEKKFDYDNQLGVSSAAIYGIKKTQFNSLDFGCIVVSSLRCGALRRVDLWLPYSIQWK